MSYFFCLFCLFVTSVCPLIAKEVFSAVEEVACCSKSAQQKDCCHPCEKAVEPCHWNFNPCDPRGLNRQNTFFVVADFLYWRADNPGSSYAFEEQDVAYVYTDRTNKGRVQRIDPSWDPGFRIGAGWNTTHDFWDLFLNYTWYRNYKQEHNQSIYGFGPLWPVQSLNTQYNFAEVSNRFLLNVGDIEWGRLLYLTKTLSIRPHVGLQGAYLSQRFQHYYSLDTAALTAQFRSKGTNKFWGIGPRLGLDSQCHFNKHWSLLAKLSGSFLYGQTSAKTNSDRSDTYPGEIDIFVVDVKDRFNQLAPHAQLFLGFQWESLTWCEKMFFKTSLGWEVNYWWNQCHFPEGSNNFDLYQTTGNQPFTTEGVTFSAALDF